MSQDHEDKQKEKQVAGLRGEAKAYAVAGGVGAAALGALEAMSFLPEVAIAAADNKNTGKSRALAFTVAAVTLGAIGYAIYKHNHADRVEASRKRQEGESMGAWVGRLRQDDAEITR